MPALNLQVRRPPAEKVNGATILIQPKKLFPELVLKEIDAYAARRHETFQKYGFTVETLKRDNKLSRAYYGYNGQYWIKIITLEGSASVTRPRIKLER